MSMDGTMSAEDKNSAPRCFRSIFHLENAVFAIGGVISSPESSSLSAPKGSVPSPTSRSYPSVTIRWEILGDNPTCHTKQVLPGWPENQKGTLPIIDTL